MNTCAKNGTCPHDWPSIILPVKGLIYEDSLCVEEVYVHPIILDAMEKMEEEIKKLSAELEKRPVPLPLSKNEFFIALVCKYSNPSV